MNWFFKIRFRSIFKVQYESRSETDVPLEILNIREKERFMDGEKDVAIISEAASSGISLQVYIYFLKTMSVITTNL